MQFWKVTIIPVSKEKEVSDRYFLSYEDVGKYLIEISHMSDLFEYVSITPCCFYYDPDDEVYS